MSTILLVIHILLAIALVGVILIQRNEGGLGGLGGGGGGSMMTGRSAANLLTRSTAIIAGLFMLNSVLLAIVAGTERGSFLDEEPGIVTPVSEPGPVDAVDTPEPAADTTGGAESTPGADTAEPAQATDSATDIAEPAPAAEPGTGSTEPAPAE